MAMPRSDMGGFRNDKFLMVDAVASYASAQVRPGSL